MKKAFKKRFDFASTNPERYLIFLKEHFTKTKPRFKSVLSKTRVDTVDGVMFAVDIVDDIENPNLDTIAECVVNGETIFLWNDHCWAVAVDKDEKEIISCRYFGEFILTGDANNKIVMEKTTVLLFQIGLDPVE